MEMQRFEKTNHQIRQAFEELKRGSPNGLGSRLKFSWSNWGFGLEAFETSCERLEKAGIDVYKRQKQRRADRRPRRVNRPAIP